MDEGLKQTIERVKRQNAQVLPISNMVKHVPSDIQRLIVAAERAEAAEAALAAVPVDALRRTLFTGYRTDAQITADADVINAWLEASAARTTTVERVVVLQAGPGMKGKTHTNEGPL